MMLAGWRCSVILISAESETDSSLTGGMGGSWAGCGNKDLTVAIKLSHSEKQGLTETEWQGFTRESNTVMKAGSEKENKTGRWSDKGYDRSQLLVHYVSPCFGTPVIKKGFITGLFTSLLMISTLDWGVLKQGPKTWGFSAHEAWTWTALLYNLNVSIWTKQIHQQTTTKKKQQQNQTDTFHDAVRKTKLFQDLSVNPSPVKLSLVSCAIQ